MQYAAGMSMAALRASQLSAEWLGLKRDVTALAEAFEASRALRADGKHDEADAALDAFAERQPSEVASVPVGGARGLPEAPLAERRAEGLTQVVALHRAHLAAQKDKLSEANATAAALSKKYAADTAACYQAMRIGAEQLGAAQAQRAISQDRRDRALKRLADATAHEKKAAQKVSELERRLKEAKDLHGGPPTPCRLPSPAETAAKCESESDGDDRESSSAGAAASAKAESAPPAQVKEEDGARLPAQASELPASEPQPEPRHWAATHDSLGQACPAGYRLVLVDVPADTDGAMMMAWANNRDVWPRQTKALRKKSGSLKDFCLTFDDSQLAIAALGMLNGRDMGSSVVHTRWLTDADFD